MEKILVVGGSYFIGKKIVEILSNADYEVFTLNRGTRPTKNCITNISCDRNDQNQMNCALKNHRFAAVIDVSGTNKLQAQILYKALDKENIKNFIFISSSAVYDVENISTPFKESDKIAENKYWTDYGKNKIEAEEYYTKVLSKTSAKFIILRPPYVYGEDNYAQRESFIFEHLYNDKPIIIPLSNPKLQFIYSKDLGNIILHLLKASLPKISIFNVGNKTAVTAKEWIEACAEVMEKKPIIIMYDYIIAKRQVRDFFPFFDYNNVLDVSKINQIYDSQTDFKAGLHNSMNWFLENIENIDFKANVTENELDILKTL